MKKKLMGLLAAVLAVSMTTSAFAAETGFRKFIDENYGDKSGTFSANDVYLVQKKLDAYVAAGEKPEDYDLKIDVNDDGRFNDGDIALLYQLALRPAETNVSKTIRVTAKGVRNVVGVNPLTQGFINRKHLGYVTDTSKEPDDYGTDVYVFDGSGSSLDTIKNFTFDYAGKNVSEVNNLLDKVSFYSAAKGETVKLRSKDGWARLCVALRFVIPVTYDQVRPATATDVDAQNYVDESVAFIGAAAADDNRAEVWNEIYNMLVVDQSPLSDTDIKDLKGFSDALQTAVVNDDKDVSTEEITRTAKEVMDIVSSRYSEFKVYYNGVTDGSAEVETINASNIADSKLITGLVNIKNSYVDNKDNPDVVNVATVANAYGFGTALTGDENIVVEATNKAYVTSTVNVFLADTLITDAQAQQDANIQ